MNWEVPVPMEYYSAIKQNRFLPFSARLLELEDILSSETNQTSIACSPPLYVEVLKSPPECRTVITTDWEG